MKTKKQQRARQPKPQINTALRQWARGIQFNVAMGRRQVFCLVHAHLSQEMIGEGVGEDHRHLRNWVTSAHCLQDRGLLNCHVWKNDQLRRRSTSDNPQITRPKYKELWEVTRAGELVVGLLKEAGIYDEVKAELEESDRQQVALRARLWRVA